MIPAYDAIIIGAGISGLTLAKRFTEQNKNVLVLEKSGGVGGRIATRRGEDCTFDHGAQFLKIKNRENSEWLKDLQVREKGKIWFSSGEYDYIAFPKGMTQFAKSLLGSGELKLHEKVSRIENTTETCRIETENGTQYAAKHLYLTCPLPQSTALLKNSDISYSPELEDIPYASALVGLFRVQSQNKKILDIVYNQDVSDEIFSIGNQFSKDVSQNLAFSVVMQPSWSAKHFEQSDEASLHDISNFFKSVLNQAAGNDEYSILNSQLKKWRYSHPLKTAGALFHTLANHRNITLLGDAFGGGSIYGAIRSAYSVPLF